MIIYCIFLILTIASCLQTNSWNCIHPLESTRIDVEKILGKPILANKDKDAVFYKTKNEKVFVLYSTGSCKVKPSNGWNLPKGRVIRISVEPTIKPKLSDYIFDRSKYKESPEGDYTRFTTFTNKIDGKGFTVDIDSGEIVDFDYFPKSKDDYLICPSS